MTLFELMALNYQAHVIMTALLRFPRALQMLQAIVTYEWKWNDEEFPNEFGQLKLQTERYLCLNEWLCLSDFALLRLFLN